MEMCLSANDLASTLDELQHQNSYRQRHQRLCASLLRVPLLQHHPAQRKTGAKQIHVPVQQKKNGRSIRPLPFKITVKLPYTLKIINLCTKPLSSVPFIFLSILQWQAYLHQQVYAVKCLTILSYVLSGFHLRNIAVQPKPFLTRTRKGYHLRLTYWSCCLR